MPSNGSRKSCRWRTPTDPVHDGPPKCLPLFGTPANPTGAPAQDVLCDASIDFDPPVLMLDSRQVGCPAYTVHSQRFLKMDTHRPLEVSHGMVTAKTMCRSSMRQTNRSGQIRHRGGAWRVRLLLLQPSVLGGVSRCTEAIQLVPCSVTEGLVGTLSATGGYRHPGQAALLPVDAFKSMR